MFNFFISIYRKQPTVDNNRGLEISKLPMSLNISFQSSIFVHIWLYCRESHADLNVWFLTTSAGSSMALAAFVFGFQGVFCTTMFRATTWITRTNLTAGSKCLFQNTQAVQHGSVLPASTACATYRAALVQKTSCDSRAICWCSGW